jgi:uncharacterized alpha-E superfamily protein
MRNGGARSSGDTSRKPGTGSSPTTGASRAPGSPVVRFIATAGSEARAVREHLAEHRWLRERLNELVQAVESRSAATVEDVVELTERAILLEIQLARHQNRLRGQ